MLRIVLTIRGDWHFAVAMVSQSSPSDYESPLTFAVQALLVRHEAYMASASRDRLDLTARIEQLETDKRDLEATNARTISENRQLLTELEALNTSVAASDTRIKALQATLQSSQQTVRHLEAQANRAAEMERHIAALELEQMTLQNEVIRTTDEAKSAMQRWRKAERGIAGLQAQLETMEREAKEERDRHAEVLERLEKQRSMEKDLDTAAGRLKGAAAARGLNGSGSGKGPVVSHFVRDLLQDNANLQLGIAELRSMLLTSNDEIQTLREQLLYHQPADYEEVGRAPTLRTELAEHQVSPAKQSQELHIHHHYHVPHKVERKKPKRRQIMAPGVSTPPFGSSPPTPSVAQWRQQQLAQGPGVARLLGHGAHDSVSTTSGPSNRWSMFSDQPSEFAPSSVPTSPISNPRYSMLEPGFVEPSSIPNTPIAYASSIAPPWPVEHKAPLAAGLVTPATPDLRSSKRRSPVADASPVGRSGTVRRNRPTDLTQEGAAITKQDTVAEASARSPLSIVHGPSVPPVLSPLTSPASAADDTETTITTSTAITEEAEEHTGLVSAPRSPVKLFAGDKTTTPPLSPTPRPALRRTVSHESIMSLANGMDIHTLKARPSQLSLRPLGATAAGTGISAVTARPTIARSNVTGEGKRGSMLLRDSLGLPEANLGLPMPRMRGAADFTPRPSGAAERLRQGQRAASATASPGTLGRLVSWRPWASSANGSRRTGLETPSPTPSINVTEEDSSRSSTRSLADRGSPSPNSGQWLGSLSSALPTEVAQTRSSMQSSDNSIAGSSAARPTPTKGLTVDGSREWETLIARAPGINQPGLVPIPGFSSYWTTHHRRGGAPSRVALEPGSFNPESLREVLEDE
jgi:hypothetical protein